MTARFWMALVACAACADGDGPAEVATVTPIGFMQGTGGGVLAFTRNPDTAFQTDRVVIGVVVQGMDDPWVQVSAEITETAVYVDPSGAPRRLAAGPLLATQVEKGLWKASVSIDTPHLRRGEHGDDTGGTLVVVATGPDTGTVRFAQPVSVSYYPGNHPSWTRVSLDTGI